MVRLGNSEPVLGGNPAPEATEARQAELRRRVARSGGYRPLLKRIHRHLRPRTYVEIGVAKGHTLALALPTTEAIGVDPEPVLEVDLPGSARVFRTTSEEFFAGHDLRVLLAGLPVDIAFIDGLHLFEVALEDFMHLERACGRDSVILVHDCNPLDEESATRHRTTRQWTGDVWKLIVCLKEYRPDLAIVTADVAPTGLGIVKNLDPSSKILEEGFREILSRYRGVAYDALADRDAELNLIPGEWSTVRAFLPRPAGRE